MREILIFETDLFSFGTGKQITSTIDTNTLDLDGNLIGFVLTHRLSDKNMLMVLGPICDQVFIQ